MYEIQSVLLVLLAGCVAYLVLDWFFPHDPPDWWDK